MVGRNSKIIEMFINGELSAHDLIKAKGQEGYTVNRILTASQRKEYDENREKYIAGIKDYMINEADYYRVGSDVNSHFSKYGFDKKTTFDHARRKGELPNTQETRVAILTGLKGKSEEEIAKRGITSLDKFNQHYQTYVEKIDTKKDDSKKQDELLPYAKTRLLFEQRNIATSEIYALLEKRKSQNKIQGSIPSSMSVQRYRASVTGNVIRSVEIEQIRLRWAEQFADCYDILVAGENPDSKTNTLVTQRLMTFGRTLQKVVKVTPALTQLKKIADKDKDLSAYKEAISDYNEVRLFEILANYFEV